MKNQRVKILPKFSLNKLLYWGLLIAFVYFVSHSLTEIEEVLTALTEGKWYFIGLAFGFEILYYLYYVQFSNYLLSIVGKRLRYREILSYYTSSIFLSVTAPGGVLGSVLFQINKIVKKSNIPSGKVFISMMMVMLTSYWSYLLLAFVSMWFLVSNGIEYATMFTALVLFLLLSGFAFGVYHLISQRPQALLRFVETFDPIKKFVNNMIVKFGGVADGEWMNSKLMEMHDASTELTGRRNFFVNLLSSGLMLNIIQATIFIYVMLAFNVEFTPSAWIVGYATIFLFSIISPTPQGIFIVEGLAQVALVAFGVDPEKALLVVLAYRAITLWIPVLVGFAWFTLEKRIGRYIDNAI